MLIWWLILKRNNLRNLFSLLLATLSLYLLDNTRLNKYIGYEKVKEYMKEDINVFGLAKGIFGSEMFSLYNLESTVSNTVIKEVEYGKGTIVYISSDKLYSTYIGTVINVSKTDDFYSVTIAKANEKITIKYLKEVNVKIYQKIEADTLIGYVDGYYYYEKN